MFLYALQNLLPHGRCAPCYRGHLHFWDARYRESPQSHKAEPSQKDLVQKAKCSCEGKMLFGHLKHSQALNIHKKRDRISNQAS